MHGLKVLVVFFILIKVTLAASKYERFGFDIEISQSQLINGLDIFDADNFFSENKVSFERYHFSNFLREYENFYLLNKAAQEHLLKAVANTEQGRRLGVLARDGQLSQSLDFDEKDRRTLRMIWPKILREWNRISLQLINNIFHYQNLDRSELAEIYIRKSHQGLKIKQELKDKNPLFAHLDFYRDLDTLEFAYDYDYHVNDEGLFLADLNTFGEIFDIQDILDEPLNEAHGDLSIHLHLSGGQMNRELIRTLNFSILFDLLLNGNKENVFDYYGYQSSLTDKGLVRIITDDHGEIRVLTMSPEKLLSMSHADFIERFRLQVNHHTVHGESLFQAIDNYGPRAMRDFIAYLHEFHDKEFIDTDLLELIYKKIYLEIKGSHISPVPFLEGVRVRGDGELFDFQKETIDLAFSKLELIEDKSQVKKLMAEYSADSTKTYAHIKHHFRKYIDNNISSLGSLVPPHLIYKIASLSEYEWNDGSFEKLREYIRLYSNNLNLLDRDAISKLLNDQKNVSYFIQVKFWKTYIDQIFLRSSRHEIIGVSERTLDYIISSKLPYNNKDDLIDYFLTKIKPEDIEHSHFVLLLTHINKEKKAPRLNVANLIVDLINNDLNQSYFFYFELLKALPYLDGVGNDFSLKVKRKLKQALNDTGMERLQQIESSFLRIEGTWTKNQLMVYQSIVRKIRHKKELVAYTKYLNQLPKNKLKRCFYNLLSLLP